MRRRSRGALIHSTTKYSPAAGRALIAACAIVALSAPRAATLARQDPTLENDAAAREITLELIMSDPEWIGNPPERPRWADDSQSIFFEQERSGDHDGSRDLIEIDLAGRVIRVVAPEDEALAEIHGGEETPDGRFAIMARRGDLFLKDRTTGEITQLTRTADWEGDPRFLGDDTSRIVFERGGETFIRSLAEGTESQVAIVRADDDPNEREEREQKKREKEFDYLAHQQARLFEWVREEHEEQEAREARREEEEQADPTRGPEPFYLGAGQDIREQSLSPTLEWMLVRLSRSGEHWGERDSMPNYVSDDGYVSTKSVRSKVGTGEAVGEKLVLLDLTNHESHAIDLSSLPMIDEDPLRELREMAQREFERRLALNRDESGAVESNAEAEADADASIDDDGRQTNDDDERAGLSAAGGAEDHRSPASAARDQSGAEPGARDSSDATPSSTAAAANGAGESPPWLNQSRLTGDRTRVWGRSFPGAAAAQRLDIDNGLDAPGQDSDSHAAADQSQESDEESGAVADSNAEADVADSDDSPPSANDNSDNDSSGDEATAEPRPVSVNRIEWTEDGSRIAIQVFSEDNKDRWIALVDLESATLLPLHHLHDPAWLGWGFSQMGWLKDNETLWYLSEESGFGHLYLRNIRESEPHALTSGEFEVSSVSLDNAGRYLYYRANRPHPGVYEVYRVDVESGETEQLTSLGGDVSYELSPDESHLLLTYSTKMSPPELYIQENRPGASAVRLTHTVSDKFESLPWIEPRVVGIPSRHGRPIWSNVYAPPGAGAGQGATSGSERPAVVFIHGAGYLQNADYGWSSHYFREFMFHTLLVNHGYIVLDMDYRASAGYGRDWRTAIYRQMGTPELEDLEDGVKWLAENYNVDPERVGVYGGSYGGFLTLMALFREPDLFACGAALRPVTDWAHYNHGYTANILNTPMVDPEAYEDSSPIEFAEGLQNPLLICHGMQDDNVFFQDTIRLAQRLIELGKEDWEVAMYPVEPHAFENAYSWLDEYRRIFKLFETHLK